MRPAGLPVLALAAALVLCGVGRAADGDEPAGADLAAADLAAAGNRLMALSDNPQDAEVALRLIRAAADRGDIDAISRLGVIYLEGEAGVEPDPLLAREYLERAVAEGSSAAALRLGVALVEGVRLPADAEKGIRLLLEAEAGGGQSTAAAMALANAYLRGSPDLPADAAKAKQYFESAAAGGDPWARFSLGRALVLGQLPGDADTGLSILEQLYNDGENIRNVATELGAYYVHAHGDRPADAEKARTYLSRAVAEGNDGAAIVLARALLDGGDIPRDAEAAVALLEGQIAADRDVGRIAYELGNVFLTGIGEVAADPQKARSYFEQAFAQGFDQAGIRLAGAMMQGQGMPLDVEGGLALLERQIADKRDVGNAAYELGTFYLSGGRGVAADPQKGRYYLEEAIAAGHGYAPIQLGRVLLRGEGLPVEVGAGLALLLTQISDGNNVANAAYEIGRYYLEGGGGVAGDPERARSYLDRAIAEGHAWAPLVLGQALLRGTGLPADPQSAVAILEETAASGGPTALRATIDLGLAFRDGVEGLAPDPEKARTYLEQAAEAGSADALVELGLAALEGKFGAEDGEAALGYFARAEQQGNGRAALLKAGVYRAGRGGIARDSQKAVAVLVEAADASNVAAARELVGIYLRGIGKEVPKDLARARTWLDKYATLESDPAQVAFQTMLLKAAGGGGPATLRQITEMFIALPPGMRSSAARQVFWLNRNAAVHVAQAILRSAGFYNGPINGQLTSATIVAVHKACAAGTEGRCAEVPLHVDTVGFIADNFS